MRPYFGLRSYTDGGEHYAGQVGWEATPAAYIAALTECTREWVRVLKPEGSLFVNLGDKYSTGNSGQSGMAELGKRWAGGGHADVKAKRPSAAVKDMPPKSLLGLPWRYALAATDQLGLILRRDIVWSKPNGLPESVTDRCRSSHEYVFHLVKQPRYYSAVDEIRESYQASTFERNRYGRPVNGHPSGEHTGPLRSDRGVMDANPLGKLPGSVWQIPSQPLTVPPALGVDHFAAFPMELPRRIILGWSPAGVCTGCGQGRRPVVTVANVEDRKGRVQRIIDYSLDAAHGPDGRGGERWRQTVRITGYACACSPQDVSRPASAADRVGHGQREPLGAGHLPPTRPAVVLDPFGGTGTTALVASALGRHSITIDLSADYCRLAAWRCSDPGERARALQVTKPPVVHDDQMPLFDLAAAP